MRVTSNISPEILVIEDYHALPGYVEIRLRENIKKVSEIEPLTKQEVTVFEYDEYTFLQKDRPGLREDVEANMSDWVITGRSFEINERASIYQDMKRALEIMGVSIDE
jgi:hypothetical protein